MEQRIRQRDYPVGITLAMIHLGALCAFMPRVFSWPAVGIAVGLYLLTIYGISLGYHRLLTHRSLLLPKPLEYVIVTFGALALQGGPIEWVAQHRAHHAHTDRDGDPHDVNRGMSWAHIQWMFRSNKDRVLPHARARWAPDLIQDPYYQFLDRFHVALSLVLAVGLVICGGWSWVIWGIFVRLVFTYHCTWLVNSASHGVGYQTYRTGDRSTNNWWVALLTSGEGWHNNHHAFPFSARHGMRWHEYDPTYWSIVLLCRLGLAKNVRLASPEMMQRLRIDSPSSEARSVSG